MKNHSLEFQGVKTLFKFMSDGPAFDVVIDIYMNDELSHEDIEHNIATKLTVGNVIQLTVNDTYGLTPATKYFLDTITKSDRNRIINTDISGKYEDLLNYSDDYISANRKLNNRGKIDAYSKMFHVINNIVSTMRENIVIYNQRISNKFAYVDSLEEKIKENNRAVEKFQTMIDSFGIINEDELYEKVGNNRELKKLLCSTFLQKINDLLRDFEDVIAQLRALLTEFKVSDRGLDLVRAFSNKWIKEPDYIPNTITNDLNTPQIYRVYKGTEIPCHIYFENEKMVEHLISFVSKMTKKTPNLIKQKRHSASILYLNAQDEFKDKEEEENILSDNIEDYFVYCLKNSNTCSAHEYLLNKENKIACDKDTWLFKIISRYNEFPNETSSMFEMNIDMEYYYEKNYGNAYVEDIKICLKA